MVLLALYFSVLFNLSVLAVQFYPETKDFYVTDGETYFVGFEPVDSLQKCNIKTGSGIDENFITTGVDIQGFVTYALLNACKLKFKATKDLPNSVTITALQANGKKDEKEINIIWCESIPIAKESLTVIEGASFIQYLQATHLQLSKCILQLGKRTEELDLESSTKIKSKDSISSLGQYKCGFKFVNVQKPDFGKRAEYALIAIDQNNQHYRATFTVTVMPSRNQHVQQGVYFGRYAFVGCGDKTGQEYCDLYNPKGELVQSTKSCSSYKILVSSDDIGVWKCISGVETSMDSLTYSTELIPIDNEMVFGWTMEETNYVTIACKLENSTMSSSSITSCKMTSPTGKKFIIHEASATDRYTALGTNLQEKTCAIKIQQPLEKTEIGRWKCEIADFGTIINVDNSPLPSFKNTYEKTVRINETFSISCSVPYSSDHCYIKSPNGAIYSEQSTFRPEIGQCSLQKSASVHDNGTWICYFAREDEADDQIETNVKISEVLNYYTRVEVDEGERLKLMCSSGGLPLKYCLFIAPNQTSYYMKKGAGSIPTYSGRGLEYGECGIEISTATESDHGTWTCLTKIGYSTLDSPISAKIDVHVSKTFYNDMIEHSNTAASLGIFIGATILCVAYVLVRKMRKEQIYNASFAYGRNEVREALAPNSERMYSTSVNNSG